MSNTDNLLLLQLYRLNSLIKETESLYTTNEEIQEALHNAKKTRMGLQGVLCWKNIETSVVTLKTSLN